MSTRMHVARILIADDEPLYLRTTGDLLRREGYDCVCVPDADEAKRRLHTEPFDLLLSDLNMPGNLRMELLRDHRQHRKQIPVIVVTGAPSLPTAIESVRLGITDYLLKPVKFEGLLASVRRALAHAERFEPRHDEIATRAESLNAKSAAVTFPEIIGNSPPMLELFEIIERVAVTDTNILITGESGTGKEVVARAIHWRSRRKDAPFQIIDCTALPESLFESALFGHKKGSFTGAISDQPGLLKQSDGGSAFFDELGELPLVLQAKLLRAVQEQAFTPIGGSSAIQVDTRFICATNRDLQLEVNAGRFRQDLFYRLAVIHIQLAPLRQRGDDIVELAEHYLEQLQPTTPRIVGFTDRALDCLRHYQWPGNVRELRNVIERTLALTRSNQIDIDDLPESLQSALRRPHAMSRAHDSDSADRGNEQIPAACPQFFDQQSSATPRFASRDDALKVAERQYLAGLLAHFRGNVSEVARQAGMSRQGLHRLLKQHHLRASDFRE
jgi:DNA-binding NtrC family response regulator